MIISFIGGGNMATALIGGLAEAGDATEIRVAAPSAETRERLARDHGVRGFEPGHGAIVGADVIVLAVKPQILPGVLAQIGEHLAPGQCVISVVAGITLATLRRAFPGGVSLVRAMPNTPSLLGLGATGLYADPACSADDREAAERVMGAAGLTVWVDDEDLVNVVTGVSGSGPAYFYLFTEALADAGERLGLPQATAETLAVHTAHGAGAMLLRDHAGAAELRRRVTSPGGTTQAAIETLETGGLRALVDQAVKAATDRGRELAGQAADKDGER